VANKLSNIGAKMGDKKMPSGKARKSVPKNIQSKLRNSKSSMKKKAKKGK